MRNPSIPRSKSNPIGQTKRILRTRRAMFRDINTARDLTLQAVAAWPFVVQNRTEGLKVNAFYEFLVDVTQITRLLQIIQQTIANGGGSIEIQEAVRGSYREGVARAVDNLAGLDTSYPRSSLMRLGEQQVLRRATLVGSRAFEQMKGFSHDTAADLSRVLFEAIQNGETPRSVARRIRKRFAVSKVRAERIARTEITMAQRRARWDEARDAEEKFGIKTKILHNSAMIPGRTRRSHAIRHGRLYTREEEALWYTINGNAINCLCSQTEVTVDKNGDPLFGDKLMERMVKQRDAFLKSSITSGDT